VIVTVTATTSSAAVVALVAIFIVVFSWETTKRKQNVQLTGPFHWWPHTINRKSINDLNSPFLHSFNEKLNHTNDDGDAWKYIKIKLCLYI
jgi:hypothetical protein